MAKPLTLDEKVKIYSKAKTGTKLTQLAKEFGVTRQTVSRIVNDDKFIKIADAEVIKIVAYQKKSLIDKLKDVQEQVIDKFKDLLKSETDIRKLDSLCKNVSHIIQILEGNPTEIRETRTLHIDAKVIANLSREKQILYLNNQIPIEKLQTSMEELKDE